MYKYTEKAEEALRIASDTTLELGHGYIGTEHILYGLAKESEGVASKILENLQVTPEKIYEKIEELIGKGVEKEIIGYTPRVKKVIELSYSEAKRANTEAIGTEHILLGILKEGESVAIKIITELGAEPQKMFFEFEKVMNSNYDENSYDNNKGDSSTPTLNQFGKDLTQMAEQGKLDPIIGRDAEIDRLIQTLSRRTKNNPCLVGEPGVGKTAVIEGLAQKIAQGNVPEQLKNKKLVSLDISAMVAGAKYRGDFEERLKKTLKEIISSKNIIIFIDEIHTIVGAGAAEGAIDAANMLKPILSRGEIQLIGATTLNEYRKYIEKDAALERRFQSITVEEPNKELAIEILKGIKEKYEAHHKIIITDDAIEQAVELSSKYINDRRLPDKAIDLIDEAASKLKLKTYTQPDNLKKLEKDIENIKIEKDQAIKEQNFEKAAKLRDSEKLEKEKYEKLKEEWKIQNNVFQHQITSKEIADIISSFTGIPIQELTQSEQDRLKNLENILHERVIGQEEAVNSVAKAIKRGRVGLKDPKKPTGSFIFLGPTGVGKTELAKALAQSLFGDENLMIRIDMSEFMEQHTVSKLIGSPPGYVGFEDGGQLTEKIRRKPYSVVLFDEVEKAHPEVLNILLQILDDGVLTDSQGRKVSFKNSVVIMTSNVGAKTITDKKSIGFENSQTTEKDYQNIKTSVMAELKKAFKPEFLNRVDDIIVFHQLTQSEIKEITKLLLNEFAKLAKNTNINIVFEDDIVEYLAKKGYDKSYGARPLKRTIQSELENKLAEDLLDNKFKNGDTVKIKLIDEQISFEKI